jgi:RNA polymerase sigma-70 factor, ECF subfamily
MTKRETTNDVSVGAKSDAEIMSCLKRGEMQALGELYLRYGDAVLRLLGNTMQNTPAADIEDICQDVFMTAFRIVSRYEEMGKLRSWLFKIALSKGRAFSRKRWVRSRLLRRAVDEQVPMTVGIEKPREARTDEMRLVSSAISTLSREQREVLMLTIGEGMSGKQIAETLRIGHGAVRARLHRARTVIRAARQESGDDR